MEVSDPYVPHLYFWGGGGGVRMAEKLSFYTEYEGNINNKRLYKIPVGKILLMPLEKIPIWNLFYSMKLKSLNHCTRA